jgi:ankyrin repeat protein
MDLLCNLKQAVINDDIKTVEEILLYHCDSPNQRSLLLNSPLDSDSSSLLHLAANISSNMINLLLLHGAYIDHQDNDGYAALHFAVINGCIEGVKALLANGANLELIDDEMMTPQDHAAGKDNILCLFDDVKIIDEDNGVNDISMCQTFVNLMMNDTAIVADDDDDTVTMITDKVAELKIEKDNKTTTSDEKENTILLSSIDDACNLSSLSNEQLRDKLLSYGERPGPINNNTRKAYITYLEKIISGIQPCGNHGYNGNYNIIH